MFSPNLHNPLALAKAHQSNVGSIYRRAKNGISPQHTSADRLIYHLGDGLVALGTWMKKHSQEPGSPA